MKTYIIYLIITVLIFPAKSFCQITRGALDNEIYFCSHLYDGYNGSYWGFIRSDNNGKTIELQYMYTLYPYTFDLACPIGDANPGTIYAKNQYSQTGSSYEYSMDYGISWQQMNDLGCHASGCIPGEIYYIKNINDQYSLWRSVNYGNYFDSVNSCLPFTPFDVGTEQGELYGTSLIGGQYFIYYSNDYGMNFTSYSIDTNIIYGWYSHSISRGVSPGELYLVSISPENIWYFNIFYSNNYGHDFELKFTSDSSSDYYHYSFTAGRQPGQFYMLKQKLDSLAYPVETEVHIYYSVDTAKTFRVFFHDMKTIVGLQENKSHNENDLTISPNPVSGILTVGSSLFIAERCMVEIFNLNGKQVKEIQVPTLSSYVGINTQNLNQGLYLVKVSNDKGDVATGKVLVKR